MNRLVIVTSNGTIYGTFTDVNIVKDRVMVNDHLRTVARLDNSNYWMIGSERAESLTVAHFDPFIHSEYIEL